jgi:hypothetical protein
MTGTGNDASLIADNNSIPEGTHRLRRLFNGSLVVLVAGVSVLFQLYFFDRWFSAMDEGHVLQFAQIVADGGELYRDATLYPLPGAFYLLSLAFQVFEPSILVSRWIVLAEFSLFVALVFILLRPLVTPWGAAAGVFLMLLYRVWTFPHWHFYSYSTTALLILLASFLALLRFFKTERRSLLALAGLFFGLGVLCKQDYGAAALVATGFSLAIYVGSSGSGQWKSFLGLFSWFLIPAALVGVVTALHFLSQGLLGELIQQTVLNHLRGIARFDYSTFPSLFPLFVQDPALRNSVGVDIYMPSIMQTVQLVAVRGSDLYLNTAVYDTAIKIFFYLPYPILLAGMIRAWQQRDALNDPNRCQMFLRELVLLSFATSLILLILLSRPQDYLHLAVLYWPLLCLVVIYAQSLLASHRRLAWTLGALFLVPAGMFLGYSAYLIWGLRNYHSEPVPTHHAGVYVRPSQAQMLGDVVEYVHRNSDPNDPVAVMPYFPIIQFLAERRGPHPSSYIVWPFPEYPDRDRRIIDAMEATGTQVVIYNFTQFLSFPPFKEYAPELFSYLVDNFETARVFSYDAWGYKLAGLKRTTQPADGNPIFSPDGSEALLTIDTGKGPVRPIPPEERARYMVIEDWPFRPVMALRPSSGGARTVVSASVELPSGALLKTAVGVNPSLWFEVPAARVEFKVGVKSGERRKLVYSRTLDATRIFADRGWFDVEVSLGAYAGRTVTLEFSTSCDVSEGEKLLMGGWAEPRILARSETTPEPR